MKLSAKARKRLTMLRDFFKTVPSKRVDLDTYACPTWTKSGAEHPMKYDDRLSVTECKAVGCLYGWGTAIPTLRKAGLQLSPPEGEVETAARVFDIPFNLARDLFDSRLYDREPKGTDKQCALNRLRRVLDADDIETINVFQD